jgi:hypothetical protein
VRIPETDDEATRRSIAEVPATELQAAIERVVIDAMQVGHDELTFVVARLYGWNRRGSDIAAELASAVAHLLSTGRLERDGQFLRTART